jgi:hypothetical protein
MTTSGSAPSLKKHKGFFMTQHTDGRFPREQDKKLKMAAAKKKAG